MELLIICKGLLAKEWDYSGPPGILDISDIVAALLLAPSETLAALKLRGRKLF